MFNFRSEVSNCLPDAGHVGKITLIPCANIYKWANAYLKLFRESKVYLDILQRLSRYIIASLEADSPKLSYIGIALNKTHSISWIRHIKLLLHKCCMCMEKLKPGKYIKLANMSECKLL